jgi:two-component system, OmpR family, sensor histidine kinase MprB
VTLRRRIAGSAGLAVAVVVLAVAIGVYVAVRSQLRGEVDDALRDRARPVAEFALGGPGPGATGGGRPISGGRFGAPPGPREGDPGRFGGAQGYVQFVAPDGAAQRPPDETGALPVSGAERAIAAAGEGESLRDVHVEGAHLRLLTVGAGGAGAVQVARPLNETDSVLHRVLWILIGIGVAGIALAAVLGEGVARSALAPVRRFTDRTETIAAAPGDPSRRMDVERDDELGRLAVSFNTTLDALERSVEAQRQLVADASHELRTPIASLRANIQVLDDADRLSPADREALRNDVVAELDELTALVADVVELARGAKPGEALDDVRLDLIVSAQVERAQRRAGDAATFKARIEPTVVGGEPERISRAVSNLLDNARRWSPPGGVVEVELRDGTLSVRDHGPGFEPGDLPRVFERFFRSDRARSLPGSGLGLAIVRQAAEAHGGSAEASNAPDGGALVRVRFGNSYERLTGNGQAEAS